MGWLTRADVDAALAFASEAAAMPGSDRTWIVARLVSLIPADGHFYSHVANDTSIPVLEIASVELRAPKEVVADLPPVARDENPYCATTAALARSGRAGLREPVAPDRVRD